ncbi:hypothetical protein GXM_04375 [Nostoc sphaeroides CCNUC1]|uniref:Uncharacterized protein n=1 Tax=Nostoc sphaeroides CCNUC1 TaxID=2653204 RepID=A0A5P8W2Q6_9NOSO|nr:hypothetical protein GXM_04375 [Nostoc sphaeroides CCNUC1]
MIQKDLGDAAFAIARAKCEAATRLSTFSREKFEWRLPTYTPGHLFEL